MNPLPRLLPMLLLLLPSLGMPAGAGVEPSAPASITVFLNEEQNPLPGPEFTVPHHPAALRFEVRPGTLRCRYRLEGLETAWRERTDQMQLIIRFFDRKGDQISQKSFPATGVSPGWGGSVEKSGFTPRRETVKPPDQAQFLSVIISSAGPPALVGVLAVTGITIRGQGADGNAGITYLEDGRNPGENQNPWFKSGTHPSMASARNLEPGAAGSPVFILADDDPKAHADWISTTRALPGIVPGEVLELEWQEAYSTGLGGGFTETYQRLPAGAYRFIVEGLSLEGVPLGAASMVSLKVPAPYWESLWFQAAAVAAAAAGGMLGGRYLIRKRVAGHLRQAQLLSDERLRIARDLHDDLGTRLSHISLLGAHAGSHSADEEARSSFAQITTMSRELIRALSENVWLLNPKNNQLEALMDFLCRLVSELCRLAEIRCRIDAAPMTENVPISHEFRHNISLAVKEVVNNALKHSKASEIRMNIKLEGPLLKITLADNGIGLSAEPGKTGVGLASIHQRMASLRGRCVMEPATHGGLKVLLEAPIHHQPIL
jgi:signal transduction histidine kinase